MMNTKSLMMLGLAVVFGLMAMLLTRQMLAQDSGKAEESQEVLVAARDVKEEELLKPDVVKVIRMAKSAVPAGAFATPKDVEERWVKTALLEGDVVIEKKLGPKGTPPGLVANIPKGMRAFAIDVTEQTGVSGFILPGHRVDVVRSENDHGAHRAESILQNVLVLASGQVFTRAEERSLTTRTVTLAVTPDQVDVLVAARARGTLALALRGVNDHDIVDRPKPAAGPSEAEEARWKAAEEHRAKLERELAAVKAALAAKAAASPAARPPVRHVHVYRGGRSPARIPLDGGAAAEVAARRPESIPGVDAGDQPGLAGPGAAAGAGAAASQPIDATALIRQMAASPRPGS